MSEQPNGRAASRSIASMTGFGAATFEVEGRAYRVELKSVNHRNLNIRLRFPSELQPFEASATRLIGQALERGAVDAVVTFETGAASESELVLDRGGLRAVMSGLQEVAQELSAPPPTLELALRLGEFASVRRRQADPEALEAGLTRGLETALERLVQARVAEGVRLAPDIHARLQHLKELLAEHEAVAPRVAERYHERLRKRLAEARAASGLELDEARLATELVVFADRFDITEEVVRARTHLERFAELIDEGGWPLGKRMDFLVQELLREFNTIGSKCRDAGMAEAVVEAKVELEKIREQVQNIA